MRALMIGLLGGVMVWASAGAQEATPEVCAWLEAEANKILHSREAAPSPTLELERWMELKTYQGARLAHCGVPLEELHYMAISLMVDKQINALIDADPRNTPRTVIPE